MKARLIVISLLMFVFSLSIKTVEANILINDASWIRECQDDRIYLRADRLIFSDEGIYIIDDYNARVPLAEVCSDAQGIYMKMDLQELRLERTWGEHGVAWCHTCGAFRDLTADGRCRKCGNIP